MSSKKPKRTRRGVSYPSKIIRITDSNGETNILPNISESIGQESSTATSKSPEKFVNAQANLPLEQATIEVPELNVENAETNDEKQPDESNGENYDFNNLPDLPAVTTPAREVPGTTGADLAGGVVSLKPPSQNSGKPKKRQFTVEYKLAIVDQAKSSTNREVAR